MEPQDQRVFLTEQTTVEVDMIDIPADEIGECTQTSLCKVDTIIMDNFHEGLVYFKDCLHKFNRSSKNPMLKTYLGNYLKLYINCALDIAKEIKRSPDTITAFDKELKIAKLNPEIRRLWLNKVYNLLIRCIKKKGLHHLLVDLVCYFLGSLEFRTLLLEKELNPDWNASRIEKESLIGLVVNSLDTDNDSDCAIIAKMLFPIIYSFNENGQSPFCRWLCYVYNKNKLRCQAQSPPDNLSSDTFMMKCLTFVIYIWSESFRYNINLNDFEEEDIVDPNAKMLVCCYKIVEISVIPMLSRIDYLKYRLREFQGIDTNIPFYNYLNNFRTSMTRKIQSLEKLLTNSPNNSFKNPIELYSWIATLLKGKPLKTEISRDLVDSICTFTILSYELQKHSFKNRDIHQLLLPISELSLDAFQHSNPLKLTNPHTKLLAFRCFHLLTDIKVYDFSSSDVSKCNDMFISLLSLYGIAHRLDESLSGSSANLKKLIMTFFYQNSLPQKNPELIAQKTYCEIVERFLTLAIADLNVIIEYLVEDEKYYRSTNSTALESVNKEIQSNNSAAVGYLKVIRSVSRFYVQSSDQNIFLPSLASSTSFICSQLNQITQLDKNSTGRNENPNSLRFLRLTKELGYLMTDLSGCDAFMKYLLDRSVGFKIHYAEYLFKFTNLEREEKTKDFLNKARTYIDLQKNQREIPAEFCDPLLCTPIENPIILPGTTLVMDKAVIERYLLEKPEDPFSRKPLTIDEVYQFNQTPDAVVLVNNYHKRKEEWEKNSSKEELQDQDNNTLADGADGSDGSDGSEIQ